METIQKSGYYDRFEQFVETLCEQERIRFHDEEAEKIDLVVKRHDIPESIPSTFPWNSTVDLIIQSAHDKFSSFPPEVADKLENMRIEMIWYIHAYNIDYIKFKSLPVLGDWQMELYLYQHEILMDLERDMAAAIDRYQLAVKAARAKYTPDLAHTPDSSRNSTVTDYWNHQFINSNSPPKPFP